MIIADFSNFLNHHQKLVADELASTEGIDYIFAETVPMYDWLKERRLYRLLAGVICIEGLGK